MIIVWIAFLVLILALVMLDLGVFHRKARVISIPEALAWTGVWIVLALAFNVFVFFLYDQNWLGWTDVASHDLSGKQAAVQFFTGYLLEKSLSVDNIFVIAMIFKYFKIEGKYQHNILFWGILGAVFFRLGMIVVGVKFIEHFEYATYVFGGILLFSAFKMMKEGEESEDFERSIGVRLLSKVYPIDWKTNSGKYLEKINGKRVATRLLAALVVVEFSDILFAVDSIPAIFSITTDSFIVFTSLQY